MKMRMPWLGVLALLVACGGPVQEEEETVGTQEAALAVSGSEESVIIGGGACGTNTCAKGTFCCNSSCGWCAPAGGGCPQVVCDKAN